MVVYTGTAGSVINTSEFRQTPSETHAREDSDTSLSVRELSAHIDTVLLQEQLTHLKAEFEKLATENAKLKSRELLTLQEQVSDNPSISLREEVHEHVKGIHSRIDKIHELYMSKLDRLEHSMAQVIEFFEDFKVYSSVSPKGSLN